MMRGEHIMSEEEKCIVGAHKDVQSFSHLQNLIYQNG